MCNSAIIDNHLYSDHIPLQLILSLVISHDKQIELPFEVRQSWCKATNHDIRKYKDNLDEQLDNIVLCDSVVYCKDHTCTKHRENLCKIYSSVIDSCVTSSQHIPNNSSYKSSKVMPGLERPSPTAEGGRFIMARILESPWSSYVRICCRDA